MTIFGSTPVLLHARPAIVEFYDWLLYEVSPSTLKAASVVGEPQRQRGGPALPATNLNPRIKHCLLLYFGNTAINFFSPWSWVSPFVIV